MADELTLYCTSDIMHDGRFFARGSAFPLVDGPDVDALRGSGHLKTATELVPPVSEIDRLRANLAAAQQRIAELEQENFALKIAPNTVQLTPQTGEEA